MKRKTIYLLQCIVVILLLACSEDDLQSLQAAFESDLQEVTIGESITFKDISTGEPSKWNWRFEGGEPETSILVLMLYIISLEFIRLPCLSDAEKKQTKW